MDDETSCTSSLSFSWSSNIDSKLSEIAANIATSNFDRRYSTYLYFDPTIWWGVQMFLHLFRSNVIINSSQVNPALAKKTRQFVLFIMNVTDMERTLLQMRESEIENIGKFIIICRSDKQVECNETEAIKIFWQNKIVDIIFLKSDDDKAASFTYFPVTKDNCNNIEPYKLNDSFCGNDARTTCNDIYGKKLNNLYSCPLIVSTFIQAPFMSLKEGFPKGSDGDLLRIIGEGLNTTIIMRTPHRGTGWGWRQKNGTWMGSLADVHEDLANFSMTSAAITQARFSDFHISRCYYFVNVGWVTHSARSKPVALKLLYPFRMITKIALAASFGLVVTCAFILRTSLWRATCEPVKITPKRSLVFYSWLICMSQPILKFPSKSALLQIILLWIWYCFLIRTAYQIYLISSLKGRFYEEQFETIEDAILAGYSFGGNAALRDYYVDYPQIYDNWVTIDASEILPTAVNISKGMRFVLAINLDRANDLLKKHCNDLHILNQNVINSPTAIFFKKYSPLADRINTILQRLSTLGFPDKFHKKYTDIQVIKTDNAEEKLNMHHYTGCYVILILGWIVSTISLALEIYFGKK